jgi:anti-sigma factor RsiW
MNCREVLELLDDYVDGDLHASRASQVRRHVEECSACREEERALRRLLEKAASLPASVEPSGDVWERIAFRLGRFDRSGSAPGAARRVTAPWWSRRMSLAAAVLLVAVAAGLMLARVGRAPAIEAPVPQAAVVPSGPEREPVAASITPVGVQIADEAFLEARQKLMAALDERKEVLSPETVRTVQQNLKLIEGAVDEIQSALSKDPGNSRLNRMLVATRQREVALLRQVTQTAALRSR